MRAERDNYLDHNPCVDTVSYIGNGVFRTRRQPNLQTNLQNERLFTTLHSKIPAPTPELDAEYSRRIYLISTALEKLRDVSALMCIWRFGLGPDNKELSEEEISEKLGVPIQCVYSRINLALKELFQALSVPRDRMKGLLSRPSRGSYRKD